MPNLSVQDMLRIKSLLNLELLQVKKYSKYANTTKDPQLKTSYEQICAKHQVHYKSLIEILNQN
ncbi:MAG: ferritin-like domain-containing protein [Oscillospiraceae bacterium]